MKGEPKRRTTEFRDELRRLAGADIPLVAIVGRANAGKAVAVRDFLADLSKLGGAKKSVKYSDNFLLDLFIRYYGDGFALIAVIFVLCYNFSPLKPIGLHGSAIRLDFLIVCRRALCLPLPQHHRGH